MYKLIPLFLVAAACSDQNFVEVPDHLKTGDLSLSGRVCDTEAREWLQGAIIYTHLIDSDGRLFNTLQTVSDEQGNWVLDGLVASVTYTVYVQHGSQVLDLFDVEMGTDDRFLDTPECANPSELSVAVITADYDDFEDVLHDAGVSVYDLVNGKTGHELIQFLSDEDNLATYDVIFFPGGHLEEDVFYDTDGVGGASVPGVLAALRGYVQDGGVIFASDWSYDVVERIWPDAIDFLGEDTVPNAAELGEDTTVNASITDSQLETAVGSAQVQVKLDLDAWPVVETVGADTRVLMRGDAPWRYGMQTGTRTAAPLTVSFEDGNGKVIYTSWRQSANLGGEAAKVTRHLLSQL